MSYKCEHQQGNCWMTGHPEDQYRYKGVVYAFVGYDSGQDVRDVKKEFTSGRGEKKYTGGGRWYTNG